MCAELDVCAVVAVVARGVCAVLARPVLAVKVAEPAFCELECACTCVCVVSV